MIVHARHPLPASVIPKGSRNAHLDFLPMSTPVEVRELTAAELGPGHVANPVDQLRTVHAYEGGLWTPLLNHRATEEGAGAMTAAELAAFMEGEATSTTWHSDVPSYLNGTPLMARPPDGGSRRGRQPDPGTRVAAADPDRAEGDVRSFAASGIALFGGLAYVRLAGPVVSTFTTRRGGKEQLILSLTGRGRSETLVGSPRDPGAFWEAVYGFQGSYAERSLARIRSEFDALPAATDPVPHDAMHFAHRGPAEFLARSQHYMRLPEVREAGTAEEMRAIHGRLLETVRPSTTGSLGVDGAEQAVSDLVALSRLLYDAVPRATANDRLFSVSRFAEAYALPRLRADAPASEADAEALGAAFPSP